MRDEKSENKEIKKRHGGSQSALSVSFQMKQTTVASSGDVINRYLKIEIAVSAAIITSLIRLILGWFW